MLLNPFSAGLLMLDVQSTFKQFAYQVRLACTLLSCLLQDPSCVDSCLRSACCLYFSVYMCHEDVDLVSHISLMSYNSSGSYCLSPSSTAGFGDFFWEIFMNIAFCTVVWIASQGLKSQKPQKPFIAIHSYWGWPSILRFWVGWISCMSYAYSQSCCDFLSTSVLLCPENPSHFRGP